VQAALERICSAIAADGLAIEADFLPPSTVSVLCDDVRARDAAGELRAAGVGRGAARMVQSDVRGDRILWLDESAVNPAEASVWRALDALRLALNETLQLGLFSFEGHYALYPPGARYGRHLDRFRADAETSDVRVLSCAIYLNESWSPNHGGELRVYEGERVRDVLPRGGTLVCFLSERFEHAVLPATRERLSLTGWFRRRA
jgi:SM-20-related protein